MSDISIEQEKIAFEGDMTIYNAESFKQDLFAVIEKKKNVNVDLTDVSEFDTAGLQALLIGKSYALENEIELKLCAASEPVSEVFKLYGMSELLESHHES